jgi:DNA-directed RNA polymerase specialized sigma24 family protein
MSAVYSLCMEETNIQQKFLSAYDLFVNEIFLFFCARIPERGDARDLTQHVFKKTWRQLIRSGAPSDINEIYNLLYLNARRAARAQRVVPMPA